MSTVSLTTSLLTVGLDGFRFLRPQHKTLCRRLFGDVSVVRQDLLTTHALVLTGQVLVLEPRILVTGLHLSYFLRGGG